MSDLRQLAPGVYTDDEGTLHLDLVALCEAAGFIATPANQAKLEAEARRMFSDIPIEEVTHRQERGTNRDG